MTASISALEHKLRELQLIQKMDQEELARADEVRRRIVERERVVAQIAADIEKLKIG